MRLKLPKVGNQKVIAFVQYFDENIYMYQNNIEIKAEETGKNCKFYIFDKGMEPFGDNDRIPK